ncbi:MAG: hypothetical protein WKF97_03360 [Chitinophagaceae bacterium]
MKTHHVLLMFLISFYGCTKDPGNQPVGNQPQVRETAMTVKEKQLVENLKKINTVFKELYKSNHNVMLVNAAIFSDVYTDESVLFADLIYPEQSLLATKEKFQKLCQTSKLSHTRFSTAFFSEASKLKDPGFDAFVSSQKPRPSAAARLNNINQEETEEVSIYFPYSENFGNQVHNVNTNLDEEDRDRLPDPNDPIYYGITLVTATRNADEGPGDRPVYQSGALLYYENITANDAYADIYPTHIIGVNGIEPYDNTVTNAVMGVQPPGPPVVIPGIPREVKQVYIGEVRCVHQYDNFLAIDGNGGDSEIRFTRSDGYLKMADGHVTADNLFIGDPYPFKRRTIRREDWVEWNLAWDEDWEADNHEQYYAIFEDDTKTTREFSASISTTLSMKIAGVINAAQTIGPIAVKVGFKSEDPIIDHVNLHRDVFFHMNRIDHEGQVLDSGWPVRRKNSRVSFTFMDRTYIP